MTNYTNLLKEYDLKVTPQRVAIVEELYKKCGFKKGEDFLRQTEWHVKMDGKKYFIEVAKGRPYEIVLKTKNIKTILPNYSAIASSDKYPIKNYEGEKLAIFNEAGFLEIAIFRSNPSKVGSANSLLGLNYRDIITIQFA